MPRLVSIAFLGFTVLSCAASEQAAREDPTAGEAATPTTRRRPGEAKVAASPSALLEKGGTKKIQAALVEKGYAVPRNGIIDAQTKKALRAFQKREKIAATGLPDQLTLQRLDLDPEEILGGYATSKKGELEIEEKKAK